MDLAEYGCCREGTHSLFVSSENGKKHEGVNVDRHYVRQYKIDGNVICGNENKCDFLLLNDDKLNAYLIELKGSDLIHATRQLRSTYQKLSDCLQTYDVFFRIVISKVNTHAIQSSEYKRFLAQYPHKVVQRCTKINENI